MNGLFGQTLLRAIKRGGHAATQGTGPEGETCGSCCHYCRIPYHGKTYRKCGLMTEYWTHGPGTDIRYGDPACREWGKRKEKQQ